MRDRPAGDDSKGSRWAIFCVIVAIHGALVLLALHWVVRMGPRSDETWVLLVLPNRAAAPLPTPSGHALPPKKPVATSDTQLLRLPAPPQAAASESPPPPIDWQAEADSTVKRQAELASAPPPRALDQHGEGIGLNGGLGPDHRKKSDFAWDKKHTNRVEVLPGVVLVRLSDHCVLVFFPFPMTFCGIGKIPVRGDLLDHMRDEPQTDAKNIAP
ncbi:MAG TPA: hypothetical protein VGH12_07125 [Steroidobacteraceae bacterium]|jgi:hypothetical protein